MRRWIQIALGVLWLVDGALQLQPYMLGTGLAKGVIEPAGQGQPAIVADSVRWAAHLILISPVAFDLLFALAQLGIGAAILYRPTLRIGLAASIAWAAAVWWFGEAAGQVFSGAATFITGAPGSVLLYALLALLVWPGARTGRWVSIAWAAVWGTGALLQLPPPQRGAGSVASAITSGASMAPRWIASADDALGRAAAGAGGWAPAIVTALLVVIAAAPYLPRPARITGLVLGAVAAGGIWVVGEGLGGLTTGQATDPNTGPLLVLLAVAAVTATSEPAVWDPGAAPAPPVASRGPARPVRPRAAWVIAVGAAAGAVFLAAVGHSPPAPASAMAPKMTSAMPPLLVKVLGTRSARVELDVDDDGQRSFTQRTVTLPYTVAVNGRAESVAVIAQANDGAASAAISCTIEMDGTAMTTDRASGAHSLVSCELDP
jgi:hypothetical protein